ncbi:hypothetical protein [Streptomyces wuyuanensis]|uniref:hypothetical protein n=1 Tax=Streptomyces wuyuanensis TaxID=1196353 RepID=UPI00342D852F
MRSHSAKNESLHARWADWKYCGRDIKELRRKVFVREQNFPEQIIEDHRDISGLHLLAYYGERPVAAISAYVYSQGNPWISRLGFNGSRLAVHLGRRAEDREFRGRQITEQLLSAVIVETCERFHPDLFVGTLQGVHKRLAPRYADLRFEVGHSVDLAGVDTLIVKAEGEGCVDAFRRRHAESLLLQKNPLSIPPLPYRYVRESVLAFAG